MRTKSWLLLAFMRITTVTDSDDVVSESGCRSALFDNGSWSSIVFRRYYANLLMSVYEALHSTLAEREGWKPRRCWCEARSRRTDLPRGPAAPENSCALCTILCGRLDLSWTTAGICTYTSSQANLPLPRSFRCVDAYHSPSPASGSMLQAFSSDFLCFFPVKAHAYGVTSRYARSCTATAKLAPQLLYHQMKNSTTAARCC